jgi:hypothetical protein
LRKSSTVVSPQYPAANSAGIRRGQHATAIIDGRLRRVNSETSHIRERQRALIQQRVRLSQQAFGIGSFLRKALAFHPAI